MLDEEARHLFELDVVEEVRDRTGVETLARGHWICRIEWCRKLADLLPEAIDFTSNRFRRNEAVGVAAPVSVDGVLAVSPAVPNVFELQPEAPDKTKNLEVVRVDELASGLGVLALCELVPDRPDPSAYPRPRLEHRHVESAALELVSSRQTRQAGAHHHDLGTALTAGAGTACKRGRGAE